MRPVLTPLAGIGFINTAALQDQAVTAAKVAADALTDTEMAVGYKIREAWANVPLGSGWTGTFAYKKIGNTLQLAINLTSASANVSIGTLPVGFRPAANWVLPSNAGGTSASTLTINAATGAITSSATGTVVFASGVLPL